MVTQKSDQNTKMVFRVINQKEKKTRKKKLNMLKYTNYNKILDYRTRTLPKLGGI